MQVRESGMPDVETWESFFNPDEILQCFGIECVGTVLELGAGYGTFTLPLLRRVQKLTTVEIDPYLVSNLSARLATEGASTKAQVIQGDFLDAELGLEENSYDVILAFNIMHMEHPVPFLKELRRRLLPGGFVAIIHWRKDIETPRGPPLPIRPTHQDCANWCDQAGFCVNPTMFFPSSPYHFGLKALSTSA